MTIEEKKLIRQRKFNRLKVMKYFENAFFMVVAIHCTVMTGLCSKFNTRIYPFTPNSVILAFCVVLGLLFGGVEPVTNVVTSVQNAISPFVMSNENTSFILALVICGLCMCLTPIRLSRLILRYLLSYNKWMYESQGKPSIRSTVTVGLLKAVTRLNKPMFHSFEDLIPSLPIPKLNAVLDKHLKSVRPLLDDEQYAQVVSLSNDFRKDMGPKLHKWIATKFKHSHNYVTDWWTEYRYLRSRDSVLKNCYVASDLLFAEHPTKYPPARAAAIVTSALQFQHRIENDKLKAIMGGPAPFCPKQFDLWYNTCRIPGVEIDAISHWNDSFHIAVYANGCWYTVPTHVGQHQLEAADFEKIFEDILNNGDEPEPGEAELAALTATDRTTWATARQMYFSHGINKDSLDAIEQSMFVLAFDNKIYDHDPEDHSKLTWTCTRVLLGNGHNRWYDKSMQWCISANGWAGCVFEHSWGDGLTGAAVGEFMSQHGILEIKYTEDGHMLGKANVDGSVANRLCWNLSVDVIRTDSVPNCVCLKAIGDAMCFVEKMDNTLQAASLVFEDYGKGFIKKQKLSPDAYIHMAVQLAHFKDQGHLSLTYHAATHGLFYNGRTETIRSVTQEAYDFVRAMYKPEQTTKAQRIDMLRRAAHAMKQLSLDAICGKGIDRYLFSLYVASQITGRDSPFLNMAMSEPWALWTSNVPTGLTGVVDCKKRPDLWWTGGISWPIEHGYGVGLVMWEETVIVHVTATTLAPHTEPSRFRQNLIESLHEMADLFS